MVPIGSMASLQNYTISEDARKVWHAASDEHEQIWAKMAGFQEDKVKHDPKMEELQCLNMGLFDVNDTVSGLKWDL